MWSDVADKLVQPMYEERSDMIYGCLSHLSCPGVGNLLPIAHSGENHQTPPGEKF